MGKYTKAFFAGVGLGILQVLAFVITVAGSYIVGLATVAIGLLTFAWIVPNEIMDNLPGTVLASVILVVPFLHVLKKVFHADATKKLI